MSAYRSRSAGATAFERLAERGVLQLDDPRLAAAHFNWLIMSIPVSRVIVINHLTLDGVMQAPGRPDEDLRGGFEHGGWSPPYGDAVMGSVMGERMGQGGALLLGRRTCEDFAGFWPNQCSGIRPPALHRRRCICRSPARRHQNDDYRRRDRDLPAGRTDGREDHLG